jgi:hypothetical protein
MNDGDSTMKGKADSGANFTFAKIELVSSIEPRIELAISDSVKTKNFEKRNREVSETKKLKAGQLSSGS